jgi:hypothetical protein
MESFRGPSPGGLVITDARSRRPWPDIRLDGVFGCI